MTLSRQTMYAAHISSPLGMIWSGGSSNPWPWVRSSTVYEKRMPAVAVYQSLESPAAGSKKEGRNVLSLPFSFPLFFFLHSQRSAEFSFMKVTPCVL
jgi:hypothetical protein